ncbi:Phosphotyrosine-binding domain protein, partial [Opisthorchis viverrini]
IDLVRADPPGTFVVRNSGSFPRSFGLVVKVSRAQQADTGDESEVVRHYLIEGLPTSPSVMSQAIGVPAASLAPSNVPMGPTAMSVTHGPVRLRGCSNEPIFTNLVSLLYEHVVQPLALPFALRLPFKSPAPTSSLPSLIALSTRSGEPMDRATRPHRHHTGGHLSEDSPRGPAQRGQLTRHPSDPLPGDVSVAAVGSYYSSSHATGQLPPGQYPSGRQDGLAPPHSRGPFSQGRSPPSAYETEFGPMPFGVPTGKWRTFTSIYLGSIDTENLTGSSAIRKAVDVLLENSAQVKQTEVTIKVTQDGLTVTDNWRKLFFRRHYPLFSVSYCAIDPAQRCWESQELRAMGFKASRIFGFVARKQNTRENMCHVFCDTPDCSCSTITEYIMYRLNDY